MIKTLEYVISSIRTYSPICSSLSEYDNDDVMSIFLKSSCSIKRGFIPHVASSPNKGRSVCSYFNWTEE
jgi:hypothetical protein